MGRRIPFTESADHRQAAAGVRQDSSQIFQEYTDLIDNQSSNLSTLRSLMKLKKSAKPVPLEEVEPAKEIVKRFTTGAMPFGSISKEAPLPRR